MSGGDKAAIAEHENRSTKLFIFLQRDPGTLLEIAGNARKAMQYEIGNPITGSRLKDGERSGVVANRSRDLAVYTRKGEAHPLSVREAHLAGDHLDR